MQQDIKKPIAICVADIHLSLTPPIWRSAEPDWQEAMKRPLIELETLQKELNVPIICAGDIFDRWYGAHQSSELVNFALENLPNNMYCIPGQHDLPFHSFEEIRKSAYYTLVQSKKITDIAGNHLNLAIPKTDILMTLHGCCYGEKINIHHYPSDSFHISVAHQYVWKGENKFPGAKITDEVSTQKYGNYDFAVFGDNHKGFITLVGGTRVINCGGFYRRKSDEINYTPFMTVLFSDGSAEKVYLKINQDKYLDICNEPEEFQPADMKSFIEELGKLSDNSLDFMGSFKEYCLTNKVSKQVQNLVIEASEKI